LNKLDEDLDILWASKGGKGGNQKMISALI